MTRIAVIALALLAGAKVWTQDQIYRSATEDALIAAYRAKAIETCRNSGPPKGLANSSEAVRRKLASAFATPADTHLEIGNPDIDVSIWQVDHTAWPMRYKYPYIVLETDKTSTPARCSYDIKLDRASITLL